MGDIALASINGSNHKAAMKDTLLFELEHTLTHGEMRESPRNSRGVSGSREWQASGSRGSYASGYYPDRTSHAPKSERDCPRVSRGSSHSLDARQLQQELDKTRDIGARVRVELATAQDRLQYTENSMSSNRFPKEIRMSPEEL